MLGLLHHLGALLPLVSLGLLLVVLVRLAHNHYVLTTPVGASVGGAAACEIRVKVQLQVCYIPEWVWVVLDRVKVGVRVGTLSLIAGGAIIVPDGQVRQALGGVLQGLSLGAQALPRAVNPDIEGLDPGKRERFEGRGEKVKAFNF